MDKGPAVQEMILFSFFGIVILVSLTPQTSPASLYAMDLNGWVENSKISRHLCRLVLEFSKLGTGRGCVVDPTLSRFGSIAITERGVRKSISQMIGNR